MVRLILSALFGVGLITAAGGTAPAQQPKEKAKAPPRIAIDDPKKAAEDPDFAAQGEYIGQVADGKNTKVGFQVVALGGGQFDVKILTGGLPGDGWDGKSATMVKAARDGGKVVLRSGTVEIGTIAGDALTITGGAYTGTAKRVERKSSTLGAKPPTGAAVLFDGMESLPQWDKGKLTRFADGEFLLSVNKTGDIRSTPAFGGFKAHFEFRLAWMPNSRGQQRSNSGVYVQDRYEIQVLDSFGLKGENNECGGIYTQHKPLVNMCYPPLTWQTYDIDFTPAVFDADGKKTKYARLTVLHNGVKIHDDVELPKECPGGKPEAASPGPFRLQDHGDPLVYRNIWVVAKK